MKKLATIAKVKPKKIFSLKGKKIVVTGGNGFLGSHLVAKIKTLRPKLIRVPARPKYDLRKYSDCLRAFRNADIVFHLAANVGGIGYNREKPAELFDDNILMGVNAIRAAYKCGVKKLIAIGTICEYPKYTPLPFQEKNIWSGYPEESNAPYGMAKKMLLVQSKAYFDQYKFVTVNLLPVNLYGPGDNFDAKSSHVIPSLIRKFVEAKYKNAPSVEIWGSGKATREFLFVKDAAEAIVLAAQKVEQPEPINLGSGQEISIKNLALKIGKIVKFNGKIIFNKKMPDGQPRRRLSTAKAKHLFGFAAKTHFDQGLKETINWFLLNKNDVSG